MGFSDGFGFGLFCISVLVFLNIAHSVELNFELPDKEKQCFHELIDAQVEVNIEYQVQYYFDAYFMTYMVAKCT